MNTSPLSQAKTPHLMGAHLMGAHLMLMLESLCELIRLNHLELDLPDAQQVPHAQEFQSTWQNFKEIDRGLIEKSLGAASILYDTAIVGGGLSGLMTALELSFEKSFVKDTVCLLDGSDTLGGRLVSRGIAHTPTSSGSFEDMDQEVRHGGFSLGVLAGDAAPLTQQILELLRPEEKKFLSAWLRLCAAQTCEETPSVQLPVHSCLVVRKDLTSIADLLSGSSENLTKAGSAALASFFESRPQGRLAETEFWKNLKKNQREELFPLFETIAGEGAEKFQQFECEVLLRLLESSLGLCPVAINDHPLGRQLWKSAFGSVSSGLERILRCRGVHILLESKVSRSELKNIKRSDSIDAKSERLFESVLVSALLPLSRVCSRRLVVAVPLAQALGFLPREFFSPSESRFVMKVRPRSLVALEIDSPWKAPEYERLGQLESEGRLIFPVERVLGFKCEGGRLILYAWMDYEVSMQAPGVREVLGRLKRAFKRIFPNTELDMFTRLSKSTPSHQVAQEAQMEGTIAVVRRHLGERLILVPVAQSVPCDRADQLKLEPALQNFWFVGEQYEKSIDAWQSVIRSSLSVSDAIRSLQQSSTLSVAPVETLAPVGPVPIHFQQKQSP